MAVSEDKIVFTFEGPMKPWVFQIGGGKWTTLPEGVYLGEGSAPGERRIYSTASVRAALPEEARTGNSKAFTQLADKISKEACPIRMTPELLRDDPLIKESFEKWIAAVSKTEPEFKDQPLEEHLAGFPLCLFHPNYGLFERWVWFDKERDRTWVMMAIPARDLSNNRFPYAVDGAILPKGAEDFTPQLHEWLTAKHALIGNPFEKR